MNPIELAAWFSATTHVVPRNVTFHWRVFEECAMLVIASPLQAKFDA